MFLKISGGLVRFISGSDTCWHSCVSVLRPWRLFLDLIARYVQAYIWKQALSKLLLKWVLVIKLFHDYKIKTDITFHVAHLNWHSITLHNLREIVIHLFFKINYSVWFRTPEGERTILNFMLRLSDRLF